MKQLLSFCSLCLLLTIAVPAYADIARPNPAPTPQPAKIVMHTGLTIVPDNKAYEARLQISQSSLQELRAALGETSPSVGMTQGIMRSSTRTVIAGVFMFLSVSFAGVWLARSVQTRGQKVVTALLLGTAVMGAAAVITNANAGPPSSYYWRKLPQNLTKGAPTSAGVDIEIVPDTGDGAGLKLIVPFKPL